MVSVTDLRDYLYCKRQPWLSRKVGIKKSRVGYSSGVRFHVLLHSITDLMHKALRADIPGEIVGTEIYLSRNNLYGRIDVVRKTKDGYILQEEKFLDPPREKRVYPEDKLQIDAYTFLTETSPYTPVISGIVMYNDLRPREVRPEPEKAKEILQKVTKLLESDTLPEVEYSERCPFCHYYSLCQVLPAKGGLKATQIKILPRALELLPTI